MPKRLNYNTLFNLIEIKCPISGLLFRAGHQLRIWLHWSVSCSLLIMGLPTFCVLPYFKHDRLRHFKLTEHSFFTFQILKNSNQFLDCNQLLQVVNFTSYHVKIRTLYITKNIALITTFQLNWQQTSISFLTG